jgi:sulfite reductase (NADPH) hemoprotein beta-component
MNLVSDIIACPGLDYCALANARAISVAQHIAQKFADPDRAELVGELKVKISGCINACGHHHVGHIGILGVDKNGEEWYQIQVGGNQGKTHGRGPDAALGKVLGPSFARAEVPDVIEKLIQLYLEKRDSEVERFIDVVQRIGVQPFKERVYGQADHRSPSRQRDTAALA